MGYKITDIADISEPREISLADKIFNNQTTQQRFLENDKPT